MTTTTNAVAIARRPAAASAPTMTEIEAQLAWATAISDATAVLPDGYRKQPGAILLVEAWARAHGVDPLTAIQNVAFVKGRPVVDAAMQRAMARRAGYRLAIDSATDSATVAIIDPSGETLGSVTYTMADAEKAGLTAKDNWRKHTREMLVAAASRLALRWHAPEVLLGVFDADEIDDDGPTVAPQFAPPAEPVAEIAPDTSVVDAVVVEEPAAAPDAETIEAAIAAARAALKAKGITQAEIIPAAQAIARERGTEVPSTLRRVIETGMFDEAVAAVEAARS